MSSALNIAHPDPQGSQRELLYRLHNLDDLMQATEEAEDKSRRLTERRRIPPVPDLRFEYSYLRSVRQYVTLERPSTAHSVPVTSEKGKEKAVGGAGETGGEVVRVQWGNILWVTTRDQVISPLLQGALWGVASHFLRPLGAALGAWWVRGASRGKEAPEGNGAQWLRNWLASILTPVPTSTTHSSSLYAR